MGLATRVVKELGIGLELELVTLIVFTQVWIFISIYLTRFMPVGPSRVQARNSQRKLSLKEPGAWPGVHINGERVGHSLQLLG